MRVTVLLRGGLSALTEQGLKRIELTDPSLQEVRDIPALIHLKPGDVGFVVSENQLLDWDEKIQDGMILAMYPVIGGG